LLNVATSQTPWAGEQAWSRASLGRTVMAPGSVAVLSQARELALAAPMGTVPEIPVARFWSSPRDRQEKTLP